MRSWMLAVSTHEDCAAILATSMQSPTRGNNMSFASYIRPRTLLVGVAVLIAGVAAWLVFADGNAGAAGKAASAGTTRVTATPVALKVSTTDPNHYPFGVPSGGQAI